MGNKKNRKVLGLRQVHKILEFPTSRYNAMAIRLLHQLGDLF